MASNHHKNALSLPLASALVLLLWQQKYASAFTSLAFTRQISLHRKIISVLKSYSPEQQQPEEASVGDYVQGVHGGKYQFEEAGTVSFAGQQFAESLYSADPTEGVIEATSDDEPLPKWAQEMGTAGRLGVITPMQRFQVLSVAPQGSNSIRITNDERSWEQFYSKIVQVESDGTFLDDTALFCHERTDTPYAIEPAIGHLAPRGGSSNLCDPSKPYSDSSTIQISLNGGHVPSPDKFYLLVVGTEAEKWYYWLQSS